MKIQQSVSRLQQRTPDLVNGEGAGVVLLPPRLVYSKKRPVMRWEPDVVATTYFYRGRRCYSSSSR